MKDEELTNLFIKAKGYIEKRVESTDPNRLWQGIGIKLREKELKSLLRRLKRFEKNPAGIRLSDRKDLLLLLLYAKGRMGKVAEPILGMTRIMKLLFIAFEELALAPLIKNPYRFAPYKLGPCAPELYFDLETLIDAKLIRVTKLDPKGVPVITQDSETANRLSRLNSGITAAERLDSLTQAFQLTPKGKRFARTLLESALKRQKNLLPGLEIIKAQFGSLPLTQLLRYVYCRYPEYSTKSAIIDKVIGKTHQSD